MKEYFKSDEFKQKEADKRKAHAEKAREAIHKVKHNAALKAALEEETKRRVASGEIVPFKYSDDNKSVSIWSGTRKR